MMRKIRLLFFIVLAVTGFCFQIGYAAENSITDVKDYCKALETTADQIMKGLNSVQRKKIAVTGIVTISGETNGLTAFLQEALATRLNLRGLIVLERSLLEQVATENSLSLTQMFDQKQAVKLGEAALASAVITGTLTKKGQIYILNTHVVDCAKAIKIPKCSSETRFPAGQDITGLFSQTTGLTISVFPSDVDGTVYVDNQEAGRVSEGNNVVNIPGIGGGQHVIKVVATGRPLVEKKIDISDLDHVAVVNIRMFKPLKIKFWQKEDGTERIIGNKGRVYNGRRYRFCFQANKDCYIYIFNKGTSGRFFPLVPNEKYIPDNLIKAQVDNMIPPEGLKGFELYGKTGEEKIYVIASSSPIGNLDLAVNQLQTNQMTADGFSINLEEERRNVFTKDYGTPENEAAIVESASLNEKDQVVMNVRYSHEK